MVEGLHILYWALSILFCLAFAFAILLWCRSWRREERQESDRRASELANQVAKLAATVDQLEHTATSLQAADELLAKGIKDLRSAVRVSQAVSAAGQTKTPAPPPPKQPTAEASPTKGVAAEMPPEEQDRFAAAREMLLEGHPPDDVARKLDIGAAEAKMLARVVEQDKESSDSG